MNNYKKLALALSISFVVMYSVMFLNIVQIDHYFTSLTRIYMTLIMVAPMAVIMLLIMKKMYQNKRLNRLIIAGSVLVFGGSVFLMRTQQPIGDIQYMKAMIPHHSSAILTSRNADIEDPEVKKLSIEIIEAQEKEIKMMKDYIKRLKNNN